MTLSVALGLGGLALGGDLVAGRGGTTAPDTAVVDPPDPAAAANEVMFPLKTLPDRRYLVDAAGRPFLIHGDTAWSLIAQLTREEVDRYLADRRARGFNTILVSLIEHHYASNAPANAYGERPFHSRPLDLLAPVDDLIPFVSLADYGDPNEAYFEHADWVLRRAAEHGLLVLLTPSYVGCCSDGWHRAMIANGPERLRAYGEFLGRRYRDFSNILWVHSGDANIPEKDLVDAVAEGIREHDPQALHTAHGLQTAALDYWPDAGWLQVNNVYTYGPVWAPALEQYAQPEKMPFFLIEGAYENERDADQQRLRAQAYQALLSGATGQVFGNNPIWHFDSRNAWPAPVSWQEALAGPGTSSMSHLLDLFAGTRWWTLEPDLDHSFLTDGSGPEDDRAVAALASDRSFALLYLPSPREITVDLARLAGPEVSAHWRDPASGRIIPVPGSPFRAAGAQRLEPVAETNSSGFGDWVLVLESHS